MPSQLSSLLVRDGLASPRRIERALMHQVARGGALDTILLELDEISEERLTHYLSLATGLPPASKGETDIFDAEAIRQIPPELADAYQVAPLSVSQSTLKVLVCEPVEQSRLQELADKLGVGLQPVIAPEYRFQMVFDRIYGRDTRERFTALAAKQQDVTFAAMAGAKTVILESRNAQESEDTVVVDVSATVRVPVVEVPAEVDADETVPMTTGDDSGPSPSQTVLGMGAAGRHTGREARTLPSADASESQPAAAGDERPGSAEALDAHGPAPLSIADARSQLAESADRDEIFELLLRGLRSFARYAGLLTVQGKSAIGRLSLHDGRFQADQIDSVLIPLDTDSAYKNTLESGAPFIGSMVSGNPDVDTMTARLGGTLPPSGLILPVALRGRVVAMAVAHSGDSSQWIGSASQSFALASDTAEAIERLLASKAQTKKTEPDKGQPASGDGGEPPVPRGKAKGKNKKGKRKSKKRDAEPAPETVDDNEPTTKVEKKRRRRRRADVEGAR